MTHHVRKRGIPVLAYPASDVASPRSCSLVLKASESRMQATLSLQYAVPTHGFDHAQTFILQYDADNLVPGAVSLRPATIPLPQARLDEIARHGNAQIRTLCLSLRKECPVWCLPSSGFLAPRPGDECSFDQLVNLAKATELHILFDYNWLHRNSHTIFQQLVDHPEQLSGVPVDRNFSRQYRRVDWSVFNASGDADAGAHIEDSTEDEEPPPYAEATNKRARHASTSPAPTSPPPKRVLLSPYPDLTPTSPTEKDSIATPSPKPPYSPAAPALDLGEAIQKAVTTLLPGMLENLLPTLLVRTSPSPSSSASASSRASNPPPPPALSGLGVMLSAHVGKQLKAQLDDIYFQTLSHASYLRNTADTEFFEVLEERKLDLVTVKDDAVDEMERAVVDKLEEFREQCDDIAEYVVEKVGQRGDEVCDHARERLDELTEVGKARIQREREVLHRERSWLGWEREVLERDKRRFEEEKRKVGERNILDDRGRRAASLPL